MENAVLVQILVQLVQMQTRARAASPVTTYCKVNVFLYNAS
jgi:hypothetical protein